MVNPKASSLPYDAGNAGDLLKHGFLAEFVRAWSKHYDKVIIYFDPFGGLPWHDPVNETVAERVKKLRGTSLASAQPDIIQKYYGSSFVMLNSGKVFGNAINAFVSDADEVHLELLRSADLQIINADGFHRTDGFSILDTKTSPDILLLDPYADFLPKRATEVIPKLASFSDLTTIVLFVLNLNTANAVGRRYESLLQNYCHRGWLAKCPPLSKTSVRGESKYYVEIVIIPAANLSNEMTYNLFSNFTGYCQTLSTILDAEITFGAI